MYSSDPTEKNKVSAIHLKQLYVSIFWRGQPLKYLGEGMVFKPKKKGFALKFVKKSFLQTVFFSDSLWHNLFFFFFKKEKLRLAPNIFFQKQGCSETSDC